MTNKYEKIDAFLEKAFEGSPNLPEACEAKIEITTNLRREYDDLLASGLDEDEAFAKTCDSLGDISELFGKKSEDDAKESEKSEKNKEFASSYTDDRRQKHPKKPPVSPFCRLAVTFGVLLCALCWVPTVLLSVNGHEEDYVAAPVLIMVALGVLLFIYSGAMRIGVSVSTHLHFFMIGLGVACEIACAAPLLITGEGTLGLTLLFVLISLGIVLIVSGAMIPCDKYLDDDDDDDDDNAPDIPPLYKPIKRMISAVELVVYFAVSFATGAWAVTWLIFLIGGALKSLLLSILKLAAGKDEK